MKSLAIYPNKETLQLLLMQSGMCTVYVRDIEKPITALYIRFGNLLTIKVSVTYADVYFKFECFSLELEETKNFMDDGGYVKLCEYSFGKVRFYARYEWERPILPQEEDLYKIGTVRETGTQENIPLSAIGICSSLDGIVFFDSTNMPLLLIAHDSEGTVEMIISQSTEPILAYVAKHEEVQLL